MTDNLPSNKDENRKVSKDEELLDTVEALPEEKKQQLTMSLSMYSGPIPHPDILKEYERLYPGAAKKMINNGVEESVHRRTLETERQKRRGFLASFSLVGLIVVMILFVIFSFLLIFNNHKVIGTGFTLCNIFLFIGSMSQLVHKLSSNDDLNSNNDDREDDNKK